MKKEGPREFYFVAMDKVKFRKPVVPGDQLVFELVTLRQAPGFGKWRKSVCER